MGAAAMKTYPCLDGTERPVPSTSTELKDLCAGDIITLRTNTAGAPYDYILQYLGGLRYEVIYGGEPGRRGRFNNPAPRWIKLP